MLKLDKIIGDPAKAKNIREAVDFLDRVGLFEALREKELSGSLDPREEHAEHIAAAYMYSITGYNACIQDLLELIEPVKVSTKDIVPDFGAREAMLREGFTEAEINEAINFRNEEN